MTEKDPRNCHERVFLATEAMALKSDLNEGLGCAYEHLMPLLEDDFPTEELRQTFRELMEKFRHWANEWAKLVKDCECKGLQRPVGSMFTAVKDSGKDWLKRKIWQLHREVVNHLIFD